MEYLGFGPRGHSRDPPSPLGGQAYPPPPLLVHVVVEYPHNTNSNSQIIVVLKVRLKPEKFVTIEYLKVR